MSLAIDIIAARHRHRYRANGMPVQGISDAFPRWLVCKDFAIALRIRKMGGFRFVFSGRQHLWAETGDSEGLENAGCQKIRV
ncbi:hypothetical protein [uncultured Bacteroides sp.]|uniref:hypothetical protein n=1 Tax=uncultured Bacteroides sp. TaxID=162156 RepID=UPI0025FA7C55|nr:hypothetical protein [uncultured Bacteroides sp.]